MATLYSEVPFLGSSERPSFEMTTVLDGRELVMGFDWCGREGVWRAAIYDSARAPIRVGMACVIGRDLLLRIADARRPPGQLFVESVDGSPEPPGLDDFGDGKRCRLVYVSEDGAA